MLMLMLAAAAAGGLKVDPDSGNNKFDARFDAPLGEMIVATSSQVACEVTYQNGAASGTCSVPLTSIMVDNEPTKTEHFQQWATNKKVDAKKCSLEAKFEKVPLVIPGSFAGDAAFSICGKPGTEKVTGTATQLPDGRVRIRARVEHFNRDKYKVGPKYTEGWLARVQQLAPVVAEEGTIEIALFAKPVETKSARKP
jgi:hypothetical protein